MLAATEAFPRQALLRACVFRAKAALFDWTLQQNLKGVFPWSSDLVVQFLAFLHREPWPVDCVLFTKLANSPKAGKSWAHRFRSVWGIKFGRGTVMAPMTTSEVEQKAGTRLLSVARVLFQLVRFLGLC